MHCPITSRKTTALIYNTPAHRKTALYVYTTALLDRTVALIVRTPALVVRSFALFIRTPALFVRTLVSLCSNVLS